MLIVIIDDCEEVREMLSLRIQMEFETAKVKCYSNPRNFLFDGIRADLIISDYCFGHTTLEFFWEKLKDYKGVIYSGSVKELPFSWPFVEKIKIEELIEKIYALDLSD